MKIPGLNRKLLVAAARDVGLMLLGPGAAAVPAAAVAAWHGEWLSFGAVAAVAVVGIGGGAAVAKLCGAEDRLRKAPSALVVSVAWLVAAALCAVPFLAVAHFTGGPTKTLAGFRDPTNAFFEAVSGLTSTGLTVTPDPRELPITLQWWRSSLQWVGGVGVLWFVLLATGDGRYRFHAGELGDEMDSDELEKDDGGKGRTGVVVRVWGLYAGLTILTFAGLWLLGGMTPWYAANHAMTASATGGFALRPDSFAAYSPAAKAVAMASMIIGACSFALLNRVVLHGRFSRIWKSPQLRWFVPLLVGGVIALYLLGRGQGVSLGDAAFNWISALCTCGFSTVSVVSWTSVLLIPMAMAMTVGGCVGSTAGGIKIARLRRLVLRGRAGDDPPDLSSARRTAGLFLVTLGLGTLAVWLTIGDDWRLTDAFFEAASALSTTGHSVGISNADAPTSTRLILAALMWLGRLEVLAVVVAVIRPLSNEGDD